MPMWAESVPACDIETERAAARFVAVSSQVYASLTFGRQRDSPASCSCGSNELTLPSPLQAQSAATPTQSHELVDSGKPGRNGECKPPPRPRLTNPAHMASGPRHPGIPKRWYSFLRWLFTSRFPSQGLQISREPGHGHPSDSWRELTGAYEFRLAGEERLDGHSSFIIDALPRRGYQPRSRTARLFSFPQKQILDWTDKTTRS